MIKRLLVALVAVVSLMAPTAVLGHPGHEAKKVMGTVSMAAADHVMVKTTDGKEQTIAINSATKLLQGKSKVKSDALKVGSRVVVTLTEKAPPTAAQIQIAAPATAAKK